MSEQDGLPYTIHDSAKQIHASTADCYAHQGPGVGAEDGAIYHAKTMIDAVPGRGDCIMEVGFSDGSLLRKAIDEYGCGSAYGVEIARSCFTTSYGGDPRPIWEEEVIEGLKFEYGGPTLTLNKPRQTTHLQWADASHHRLDAPDSFFTWAYCTETIEHLTNPYYMVANVKRCLQHNGLFVLAFPMPEDNLGYGGGQHAHVYPGFLRRESFERFMMQMYFKGIERKENGSSAWYVYQNYKGQGQVDPGVVVSGNFKEDDLYHMVKPNWGAIVPR